MKYLLPKQFTAKGFTLLELILSMGLMMVLVGILTGLFAALIDAQLESQATSSVDQDGRYILARLTHDMQSASSISTPSSPGGTGNTLQISINSQANTYSLDGSGNLRLTNTYGTNNLNSVGSSVSALLFQRIGTGSSTDTIRVSYTVTSRVRQLDGVQLETKSFQTTLGLQ